MSVVIISSDAYCDGEQIAHDTAEKLGYTFVDRERVLAAAAERYHAPREKLERSLWKAGSALERWTGAWTRHLAYFEAALTGLLDGDGTVYCGQVAHLFVEGVSHVLKVRLTADLEDRVARCVELEGVTPDAARSRLQGEAETRARWCKAALGGGQDERGRFDLVINLTQIGPERAAGIIVETARDVKFQPITYSIKAMRDRELASRVRAELISTYRDVSVTARDGEVTISTKGLRKDKKREALSVRDSLMEMEGVGHVRLA